MGPGPKVESPKQRRKQPRGDRQELCQKLLLLLLLLIDSEATDPWMIALVFWGQKSEFQLVLCRLDSLKFNIFLFRKHQFCVLRSCFFLGGWGSQRRACLTLQLPHCHSFQESSSRNCTLRNLTGESGVILRLMWILRCEYWSFSLQLDPPKPWRTGIWSAIRKIKTSTKKQGLPSQKGCCHGDGERERELLNATEMEASSRHQPPKHRTRFPKWLDQHSYFVGIFISNTCARISYRKIRCEQWAYRLPASR